MVSTFDLITYIGLSTLMDFEKCFCIRPYFKLLTIKCLLKIHFSSQEVLVLGVFHPLLCQLTIKVLAIHRKHPECTQRNWREHEEQRLFVTTKLDSRWQHEFLFSVKIVSSLPFVTLFVSSPQIGQCFQILALHWSILVIAKHTNWDPLWLKSANESHKRMIFQLLCKTTQCISQQKIGSSFLP